MSQTSAASAQRRVVLYDGVCKLCNGWVNFLIRHDRDHRIQLAAVQTATGKALLTAAGQSPEEINTIVLLENDRVYLRAEAIFRVMRALPLPWRALGVLRYFPKAISNRCYDLIALNRYRLFGKYNECQKPKADSLERFIDRD